MSISDDNDFQVHIERLLAWEADMGIQPVIIKYKVITDMRAYLFKTEDEAWDKSLNNY